MVRQRSIVDAIVDGIDYLKDRYETRWLKVSLVMTLV